MRVYGNLRTIPARNVDRHAAAQRDAIAQYPEHFRVVEQAVALYLIDAHKGLAAASAALADARLSLDAAKAAATAVAKLAAEDGMIEATLADALDVNRLTVRRWLGKKDR